MNRTFIKSILAFCFFLTFVVSQNKAQDINYAKKIVDTLCSNAMFGRGYNNNGNKIAAIFLRNEFIRLHLDSFPSGYFQTFPISINTIEGDIKFKVGKKHLNPGIDFLVDESSPASKGKFKTFLIDSSFISLKDNIDKLQSVNFSNKIVIVDKKGITNKEILALLDGLKTTNYFKAKAFVYLQDKKLTWGISDGQSVNNFPVFEVLRSSLPSKLKRISFSINNKFTSNYITQNVIGYIKGKANPDSFFVFTAHYDHLGMMGNKTMFPGANDNASGVAMALNLMQYYSLPENKPDYSIVFIATSAEELGILGSKYFCQHPLFDLSKIKFLINLDMVSTGEEGIMIVNGGVFTSEYDKIVSLNEQHNYIKTIKKRGEAKNSDHWFFYKNGVKCFFIYTLGGKTEYHHIYDKPETLPFTEYNDLFILITDFLRTFN